MADASSSNQYTASIATTVTATSPYAWIQDPLNPRGAVALYRDMSGGHVLLTLGSLVGARWDQQADYVTPIGSSLPVASLGVRQKAASVPMVLSYDAALEGGRLQAMLESAGQLVVRGPFGLVRHPIYGGVVLGLLAVSLLTRPLALVPSLCGIVFLTLKARHEERLLREAVPGYDAYCRRVRRRFIPFVL